MKRNFTAKSLFLLAAITVASIVNEANAQVEWGIIGGMNSSSLSGSKYKDIPSNTRPTFSGISRFRIGIMMDYPLNNYFSFSPEIAYSIKGGVQKIDTTDFETDISPGWEDHIVSVSNIDLNYIEIPLLFRFSTPLGHPTALYPHENSVKPLYLDFMLGPHVSYLLSSKNEFSYTHTRSSTNDPGDEYNFSLKTKGSGALPKVKKIDYGIIVGTAIKWRFSRKSMVLLDIRYALSMGNLNGGYWNRSVPSSTDPTTSITVSPKIKNAGTLSLSLGYVTNFSKRRYFNLFKPDKNRPDGR